MNDYSAEAQKCYHLGYENPSLPHSHFGIVGAENIAAYFAGQGDRKNLDPRSTEYNPGAYDQVTFEREQGPVVFEDGSGVPVEVRFFELTESGATEVWRRGVACSSQRDGAIAIEFDDGTRFMALNSPESINWRWCHD